jgi:hypothetical protein
MILNKGGSDNFTVSLILVSTFAILILGCCRADISPAGYVMFI